MPATAWAARSGATAAWSARALPTSNVSTSVTTSVSTSYATQAYDSFTDAAGIALQNHLADSGAVWAAHPAYASSAAQISNANRAFGSLGIFMFTAGAVPPSSDYTVSVTMRKLSAVTDDYAGVIGRCSPTAETFYMGYYSSINGAGVEQWQLYKFVNGAATLFGILTEANLLNTDYVMRLVMSGTSVKLVVNDITKIGVDDSAITLAGLGGVRGNAVVAQTNVAGVHLDDFSLRGWVPTTTVSVVTGTSLWSGGVAAPLTAWTPLA